MAKEERLPVHLPGKHDVPNRPKVADNLRFIGTKIHSAWAMVGSQGIIVIAALFDYAAKDERADLTSPFSSQLVEG